MKCPSCGTLTGHVHAFGERVPADVPVDGRRVLVRVRVRRMRCRAEDCARQTFREQVPGVLERYQRRTVRLNAQLRSVVRELAGRAAARLLPVMGIVAGKDTAVRALLGIALPERPVPRVLGIDDFALRRSRQYATVVIDAETGERIDVLPGRGPAWSATGYVPIPASRSCAATGRAPMPKPSATRHRARCRWPTAGTYGTVSPRLR